MDSPVQTPNFNSEQSAPSNKPVLWKWSIAIAGVVFLYFIWQLGSALYSGSKLADEAVQHLHDELNRGQYDEICREGDDAFLTGEKHDSLVRFLELVHTRLGTAGATKLVNLHVKAGTSGTFLTARYNSQFDLGQAVETFTWRRESGTLKLYGYTVQSKALLK